MKLSNLDLAEIDQLLVNAKSRLDLFSIWKKWDLRSQFIGEGGRHKILYPRFALLNWHWWSTFDLSQILVSSDTQLLSKPELMTHPQSLLGWYFVLELKLNYLISSRRPAVLTKACKLIYSDPLRITGLQISEFELESAWQYTTPWHSIDVFTQWCLAFSLGTDSVRTLYRPFAARTSSNGSARGDNKKQS